MEQINEEINNTEFAEKKRNGFITFWLWLGIIANLITAPLTILKVWHLQNLGYYGMYMQLYMSDAIDNFDNVITTPIYILCGAIIVSAILCIWGYSSLLKWWKRGFYFFFAAAVINVISSVICYSMIKEAYLSIGILADFNIDSYSLIGSACFSILILWLILRIKKNGVSCWSQLE